MFTHTEVDPAFEGKGVGGALARHALDEVAEDGDRKVMPLCPFIKAWIAAAPRLQAARVRRVIRWRPVLAPGHDGRTMEI